MKNRKNKKIIILASGEGTNAEEIIKYFKDKDEINVELIITNNNSAGVLERAKKHMIPSISYKNKAFQKGTVFKTLNSLSPDLIVLAGFLRKIPEVIISKFPKKIINIHPALLPKHGGKGMYGDLVHKSVIRSGDLETGITIHYVNQNYDEGEIIFQKSLQVKVIDSPKSLSARVKKLEHNYYPIIIEKLLNGEK